MFRLLSKESNIFSIPIYIGFLLLIVISFNFLNFNTYEAIIAGITFLGIALGYFCFHSIALNYQSHLPLFLYTFFIFGLYPGKIDVGLAVALLTNSFLLLLLTSTNEDLRKKSYVLVGSIVALNFIFLPTTWPMAVFVMIHVVATSERIGLNIFRFLLGTILITFSYFSVMFFLNYTSWNADYFPFGKMKVVTDYEELIPLALIACMMIYAVYDHFKNYNKKSPVSRYKYTFLLVFSIAQLITIILYMNKSYEYLLLLAFPSTIIISRMLRFLPKYWMQETSLWVIIFSLIGFKAGTYFNLF
jgi:F0F1-type ATP synthase assembly protein I